MKEIIDFINHHLILSISWILLLVAFFFTILQKKYFDLNQITCSEAIQLVNKKNASFIDIRNAEEYRSEHIFNSLNITSSDIKLENFGELKKKKKDPLIIVYDSSLIAKDCIKKLNRLGFNSVYLLREGISGWKKESLPLYREK